jgi:ATP-dependent RNA helicase SUPV3L1/SUV3
VVIYIHILILIIFLPQMLGCRTRGFSFTRALLGISADELHLCGDAAAAPLIQEILKVTGDEIEVIIYLM